MTDDGPGIQAADPERAFNRFARLDDTRSLDGDEADGAGLGLTIVGATTQAYGGAPGVPWPDSHSPGLRAVVRLPTSGPRGEGR